MVDDPLTSPELSEAEKKKLKALMEKDAKSFRSPSGFWYWVTALLGAFMVCFYFYAAGISTVGTQYHLGIYVGITYLLVFLLYPAGGPLMRGALALVLGVVLAAVGTIFFLFPDAAAFHTEWHHLLEIKSEAGWATALSSAGSLLPLAVAAPLLAILLFFGDRLVLARYRNAPTISDLLFALAAAGVIYYWLSEFEQLNYRAGAENELDILISLLGLLLSLEVGRRVLGWSMTMIGLGALAFAYFGPLLPDLLAHRGFGIERLATSLFLRTNGIFGVMANVLATYVILFIFFGAFLQKSGASRFFIDLPLALAGKSTGGPAKVAVIASALFGSVSGSAIANTVSTGAFTIPLMKRAGFKPHVAGAIEPSASIGGMFLPPIMGAGGFLMAELTGTPYTTIMLISIGPALLYFFSVFCMIHFEAGKLGLKGVAEEQPPWQAVLKNGWFYAIPLVLMTVLMIIGRSPGYAAFWGTLTCIAVSWVKKETRMGPKEIWEAIQLGARNTLIIGATVGVIGVIVGIISLTGMGLKFSDLIITMAGNSLLLAIGLIALASLILGMGVPVTAAYLIIAVLAVPALGVFGVPLICAHMIVYWLSQDSNITPPVCVAAYAGAAIAGADPWKTGWTAFKFAKLLYVMPLLFAFTPSILFQGKAHEIKVPDLGDSPFATVLRIDVEEGAGYREKEVVALLLVGGESVEIRAGKEATVRLINKPAGAMVSPGEVLVKGEILPTPYRITMSFVSAILGTIAFSSLTMFYWIRRTTVFEWLLLAPATLLLYWPTIISDLAGIVLVGAVWLMQSAKNRKELASP
ncbi:MAG: TRAP transporter fused permease subunit [Desulfurivibrio sp.]